MKKFDLVIKNSSVINPERQFTLPKNIGIKDGKIVAITREEIRGKKEIDACLSAVCPGFIDVHAHVDGYAYSAECMVKQGITTTIGGNCGISPTNIGEFLQNLDEKRFALNQAMMIGHSFALREKVGASNPYIPATLQQIRDMVHLLECEFEQGAAALSFGLEYAPGTSVEEATELSKVAAKYGRLIAIHPRFDGWKGIEAIKEAVNIARVTGVSLQISHLVYQVGMGMMEQALEVLDEARQEGIDVTADSGMYEAFATFIGTPVFDEGCIERWGCKYSDLFAATGKYAGQRCTREIYLELREKYKNDVVVAFVCKRKEVYKALLTEYVMVSTDGAVGHPEPGMGHPQDAGTFPKFFSTMVREKKMLSLTEAVRKCTLLPAQRLGLDNKGRIKEGADADLVIFNLSKIKDKADYLGFGQPDAPPEGIDYVIVNGEAVVDNGTFKKGVLAGRTIRV